MEKYDMEEGRLRNIRKSQKTSGYGGSGGKNSGFIEMEQTETLL